MTKIVVANTPSWQGIYMDDRLVMQARQHIQPQDAMEIVLGLSKDTEISVRWGVEQGQLPPDIIDVKWEETRQGLF